MRRLFWTWNPVASVEFRPFDEPHMLHHNEWLFDRQVWHDMFGRMADCGFDGMVFANTHPFPYMIEYDRFPQARMLGDSALRQYQDAYRWIFRTAGQYGIQVYLLFFSIHYPEPLLDYLGVYDKDAYRVDDFAIDYTRYCVEKTLETYPDLGGIMGDASENIHQHRGVFLRQAVVEPFERLAAGKSLILRGWWSDRNEFRREITDKSRIPVTLSVKYTWEHLVHSDPDPLFMEWVHDFGGPSVMAEFWISNFEPLTSYAYSTVEGILRNLRGLGCAGFSMHPLSMYEWPFTSDRCWKYQFDRDFSWYCAWGECPDALPATHKSLIADDAVRQGLEAASNILILSALYFAGDRQNQWHPQFCSVRYPDGVRLLTVHDMARLPELKCQWGKGTWEAFDSLDWMTAFTGRPTMHFHDYDPSNAEAYGPDDFANDMDSLADRAWAIASVHLAANESSVQSCLLRNAIACALIGRFWAERVRAATAHVLGDRFLALDHMRKALDWCRQLEALESLHREPFRVLTGRCALSCTWKDVRDALEQELSDYRNGITDRSYPAGSIQHRDSSMQPRGTLRLHD